MKNESVLGAFTEKLAGNKKLAFAVYAGLILTALVIFIISGGFLSGKSDRSDEKDETAFSAPETTLETRLEAILSHISGVGKVRVMLTFKPLTEQAGTTQNPLLDAFAEEEGESRNDPVRGAIIVCEGAGKPEINERVRNAVMTLLGLNPAEICVFPMQ